LDVLEAFLNESMRGGRDRGREIAEIAKDGMKRAWILLSKGESRKRNFDVGDFFFFIRASKV